MNGMKNFIREVNNTTKLDIDVDLVPYYRDLLVKAIPDATSAMSKCMLRGWLLRLGRFLEMDSMRLYLYDDRSNNIIVRQIYGDKDLWRDVDISKLSKENAKYNNLFFFKIRHIRENGQFLVLGYLSFHTERYVSKELIASLDVLCMLYGNYIVKRLVTSQKNILHQILPKVYLIASSENLPGTKIKKILECLYSLTGFNYGLFCTVHKNTIVAEYLVTNKGGVVLKANKPWRVDDVFMDKVMDNNASHSCRLSEMPPIINGFILYRDGRNPKDFIIDLFPIKLDSELVGLWMIVNSENNPYAGFNLKGVLEGTQLLLNNSYRFLFQRRFNAMIVNPIFQNRDTRINNSFVFVIMPFTEDWSDDIWGQVIKPAVQDSGMIPVRADDLYGQNIMEDVWQSILKAAVIICDTTGRNPNVFYELGIAHTLGKKVILLTQKIDDIPFDLQAYRHIEYVNSLSGGSQLKDTLKKYIKETLANK